MIIDSTLIKVSVYEKGYIITWTWTGCLTHWTSRTGCPTIARSRVVTLSCSSLWFSPAIARIPRSPHTPSTIHCRYKPNNNVMFIIVDNRIRIPGQKAWSSESPAQVAPPLLGAGLLHCLVLVFVVFPLQELQDPHPFHPPFTAKTVQTIG